MTPDKKVVYSHPSGQVEVLGISLWALIQLQRGRLDYDPTDDIASLRASGVPGGWIAHALNPPPYDLEREAAKVARNGRDPQSIPAYLSYHQAVNEGGKTLDEAIRLIIEKDIAWRGGAWKTFDAAEVPNDYEHPLRSFRNALRLNGGKVEFDMPTAREIKRDELRRLRKPKLEALDVEYQRADERSDVAQKAIIAAQKQALRDVTDDPAIEAAATPEALKTVLPAALK